MAIACQGMDAEEAVALTQAMIGPTRLHVRAGAFVADKHSTGGVGDKTTLVLAPLLAAVGIPLAKMSGRGLGHAGGTIDKLAAIPELRLPDTPIGIQDALRTVGFAIAGQTPDLAPGDHALYQLRDVTGTVESIPLIAASIMSKKIAAGASLVVLDVKTGSGALLHDQADALTLAQLMVDIGARVGLTTRAVVSDMNQPLGHAIGNALEVAEAIAALRGQHIPGLVPLVLHLATLIAIEAWPHRTPDEIREELTAALSDGRAHTALRRWVDHHGGDPVVIDRPDRLPRAAEVTTVTAPVAGWVSNIDTKALGYLSQYLGAGRTRLHQPIDSAVGLWLHVHIGQHVTAGAPLIDLHLPAASADVDDLHRKATEAVAVSSTATDSPPLIHYSL
ncbi:pyrimidine-nucleoside phosphorylase [Micromonospora endophytica]|nr:pyrimidine-nucleoside phosphorylase [Micromonospora endophytica]